MMVACAATVRLPQRPHPAGHSISTAPALPRDPVQSPRAPLFVRVRRGDRGLRLFPYLAPCSRSGRRRGAPQAGSPSGFAIGGLVYSPWSPGCCARWVGSPCLCGGRFRGRGARPSSLGSAWRARCRAMLAHGPRASTCSTAPFQTQVTEVAPQARASAVALHAFSFFCGQALGRRPHGFGLRDRARPGPSGAIGVHPGVGLRSLPC